MSVSSQKREGRGREGGFRGQEVEGEGKGEGSALDCLHFQANSWIPNATWIHQRDVIGHTVFYSLSDK